MRAVFCAKASEGRKRAKRARVKRRESFIGTCQVPWDERAQLLLQRKNKRVTTGEWLVLRIINNTRRSPCREKGPHHPIVRTPLVQPRVRHPQDLLLVGVRSRPKK